MSGFTEEDRGRCDDCPYPNRPECPMRCTVNLEAEIERRGFTKEDKARLQGRPTVPGSDRESLAHALTEIERLREALRAIEGAILSCEGETSGRVVVDRILGALAALYLEGHDE